MIRRRDFLTSSGLMAGLSAAGIGSAAQLPAAKSILDYGAVPDGKTLNTRAIQRAIDEVARAGGGLVYAPPGTFLTGGIELKSNVTLYVEAGCVLLGSTSFDDYDFHGGPPVKGDANGHHLIFARKAENVTLCGPGTIDGQGESYWENIHRAPMPAEDAWRDVSAWDYRPRDDNRRPSPMVEFAECRNVRIAGLTLHNSAGWTLRPVACETVVIDGIRVRNPNYGSNTDGMDITASSNVFVSNCDIDTGDDAICIKSENPYGPTLPTRNITITNCTLTTSCNGLKLGTASRGAFENIVFSNSVIYAGNGSPFNTRVIGGINVEVVDGGSADGIVVSNIRMQNVRAPIFVRMGSRSPVQGKVLTDLLMNLTGKEDVNATSSISGVPGQVSESPSTGRNSFLRNVLITGIDAEGAIITSSITGVPGLRPSDITVSDCRIRTVAGGKAEWAARQIPEVAGRYPESTMMGHLPAYGFYVRHADRVRLRNVECITDVADERPAIVCDDVDDAIFAGLECSASAGDAPVFDLRNTRRAFLTGMRMAEGSSSMAQVSGEESSGIQLLGNAIPKGREIRYSGGARQDSASVS